MSRAGKCNVTCPHCQAHHWLAERTAGTNTQRAVKPLVGMCCDSGAVQLPTLTATPAVLANSTMAIISAFTSLSIGFITPLASQRCYIAEMSELFTIIFKYCEKDFFCFFVFWVTEEILLWQSLAHAYSVRLFLSGDRPQPRGRLPEDEAEGPEQGDADAAGEPLLARAGPDTSALCGPGGQGPSCAPVLWQPGLARRLQGTDRLVMILVSVHETCLFSHFSIIPYFLEQ